MYFHNGYVINIQEEVMRKLIAVLFIALFLLQGYYPNSVDSAERTITQREKEQQMLVRIQEDFFVESASFDEDSRTFLVVSDFHVRAFNIAKRGEGLEMRNGSILSWEDYVNHHIEGYFKNESDSPFTFGILYYLGEGYTVQEVKTTGETVFTAKDGELIYDILNGYAN